MKTIRHYASLVKFSHTVFALPFALISYCYALWSTGADFEVLLLVKILLAMIFARNTAMGVNRYADRKIDALNPRTAGREIPAGIISPGQALWFVILNAGLFLAVAAWINQLALMLSPIALFLLVGYSYTKRFTAWCHLVLGVTLGIAPMGAYIAVTGTFAVFPILLGALVVSWVSGFDIIYALQDIDFDREQRLRSIPARFGVNGSTVISILLHLFSVYAVFVIGRFYGAGNFYRAGACLFTALVVFQHVWASPKHLDRIGPSFGLINGLTSVGYAILAIADLWFRFH